MDSVGFTEELWQQNDGGVERSRTKLYRSGQDRMLQMSHPYIREPLPSHNNYVDIYSGNKRQRITENQRG